MRKKSLAPRRKILRLSSARSRTSVSSASPDRMNCTCFDTFDVTDDHNPHVKDKYAMKCNIYCCPLSDLFQLANLCQIHVMLITKHRYEDVVEILIC